MAVSLGTSPALNRICGGAETAKPVKHSHPEHVKHTDQNPSPHVTNDTSRSSRGGGVPLPPRVPDH